MKDKLFSRQSVLLMGFGLLVNIVMVYLVGRLGLPLYLDSVGTILVSVLAGLLPGITVGFFSNAVNYFFAVSPDPLTLYYGLISVLLAAAANELSRRGLFRKRKATAAAPFVLALVGGGLGSVLTWMLYGLNFGENVSSSLVLSIYHGLNCPPFLAQLFGDYVLDLGDKVIALVLAYLLIRLMPRQMLKKLPFGLSFTDGELPEAERERVEIKCRSHSLRWKLTVLLVLSSMVLGLMSTFVGMYINHQNGIQYVKNDTRNLSAAIAGLVDGDRLREDLAGGLEPEGDTVCREIAVMEANNPDVELVSVVAVENGQKRQLFGDSAGQEGSSYIVWTKETDRMLEDLAQDPDHEPRVAVVNLGSAAAAISPVRSEDGTVVAYVLVQTGLSQVRSNASVYFIRIFSLLFGVGILIVGYLFWFYDRSILEPIKVLIRQTEETYTPMPQGQRLRDQVQVKTGDELEILFDDMCAAQDHITSADHASQSKTAFLSKLSHEIRTPLNSVIGFSNIAMNERNTVTKEELLDYMQKIQISGKYLLDLVSDVLDISRIEEGRMTVNNEPCNLDELIDEVVDSFQAQMENKNLDFIVDKQYDNVLLYMDEFHTIQILNNLISNAYKYTEEGGSVGLEIHTKQIAKKKMQVEFIVQDTGIGMSEEFQKKIFEPFTQDQRGAKMKKQLRGSGLGMSICKNLVDLLGGTITLESQIGEGSCFTVTLVYDLIGSAGAGDSKENENYAVLAGKKILVVDDLEINRVVVEKFLEAYGLRFEDAENGLEAVEKFKASDAGEYFTIFMDVQMPEMNGHEATRAIRALERADADVPIIGMTADAFSDDVQKAKQSGMNYHVAKPVQVQKVLSILMEIANEPPGEHA